MGKKKSEEKTSKSTTPEKSTEKPSAPVPAESTAKKPSELLAEKALKIMQKLKKNGIKEFNSTLLRDKLGLDKESGRDQIRRAMKRLEKDGKVVIEQKAVKGARKRYVYRLK